MNAKLRNVPDGSGAMHRNEVCWFGVRTAGGHQTRMEFGEIYWPFALVWDCTTASDHNYEIVHLPSGYYVINHGIPRRRALALVKALRPLTDWVFTQPSGKKWERARTLSAPFVRRARAVTAVPSKSKGDNSSC